MIFIADDKVTHGIDMPIGNETEISTSERNPINGLRKPNELPKLHIDQSSSSLCLATSVKIEPEDNFIDACDEGKEFTSKQFPHDDCNSSDSICKISLPRHTTQERKHKDMLRKRQLRQDEEYRKRESLRSLNRTRMLRSDPNFREKERQRDRERRKLARQRNPEQRAMERERDRLYRRNCRSNAANPQIVDSTVPVAQLEITLPSSNTDTDSGTNNIEHCVILGTTVNPSDPLDTRNVILLLEEY